MKNNMKVIIFLILLLQFISYQTSLLAQDIDEEDEYSKEWLYGLRFTSNGGLFGSIFIQHNRKKSEKWYETYSIDLGQIKNPRELRLISPITNSSFILGKKNYFYPIRLEYGRSRVLFRKVPEEGIRLTGSFSIGPTLGLVVPYYILYDYSGRGTDIRSEAYNPNIHRDFNKIAGTGTIFQGIGEANLVLGINTRIGVNLDFGAFGNTISGVGAGFLAEAFTQAPQILIAPFPSQAGAPEIENQQYFLGAYLSFFFGVRR
jgi:hypothetical protein